MYIHHIPSRNKLKCFLEHKSFPVGSLQTQNIYILALEDKNMVVVLLTSLFTWFHLYYWLWAIAITRLSSHLIFTSLFSFALPKLLTVCCWVWQGLECRSQMLNVNSLHSHFIGSVPANWIEWPLISSVSQADHVRDATLSVQMIISLLRETFYSHIFT